MTVKCLFSVAIVIYEDDSLIFLLGLSLVGDVAMSMNDISSSGMFAPSISK